MEEKDNPALVFSCETKDWLTFKDAIQMRADKHDTTWLFEGGRSLAEFFARQIKEKTDTKTTRAKALEREVAENDSNHTVAALKEWFEDKDIATGLLLSLNKNRLRNLGRTSPTTRIQGRGRAHKSPQVHRPEVSPTAQQTGCAASK